MNSILCYLFLFTITFREWNISKSCNGSESNMSMSRNLYFSLSCLVSAFANVAFKSRKEKGKKDQDLHMLHSQQCTDWRFLLISKKRVTNVKKLFKFEVSCHKDFLFVVFLMVIILEKVVNFMVEVEIPLPKLLF